MKRAVLLHGTDSDPVGGWRPYVKNELKKRGYSVWVPALPKNHTPNMKIYNDYLLSSEWDFSDNLVIGHSSGAVSVLNLLMDARCPKIKTGVAVGAWAHNRGTQLDREQFKHTFPPNGFDFAEIKNKTENILFIHGDNDPYCPLVQAKWLAERLESEIVILPNGGHLNTDAGFATFPQLIDILESRKLL